MNRDDYEWAREKEPTYNPGARRRLPLSIHGAVKTRFAHIVDECECAACRRLKVQP